MTPEEFSNEFDVILNSYSGAESIELDEYEKSVFLTKAQEEVVIDIYNGKNSFGDSFEKTEEIRRYLSNLINTYTSTEKVENHIGLSKSSVFFKLPPDLWFITYESVNLVDNKLECMSEESVSVIPITQDDYHRIKKNPFRGTNERRVLRFDLKDEYVEIVSKYNVDSYSVRYLSRPTPIILTDLPENLSINNINSKTACMLNPVLHRTILERAIKLALLSRSLNAGRD